MVLYTVKADGQVETGEERDTGENNQRTTK